MPSPELKSVGEHMKREHNIVETERRDAERDAKREDSAAGRQKLKEIEMEKKRDCVLREKELEREQKKTDHDLDKDVITRETYGDRCQQWITTAKKEYF